MNLELSKIEQNLLRVCLLDAVVNSEIFWEVEKDYLDGIYQRIKESQEQRAEIEEVAT